MAVDAKKTKPFQIIMMVAFAVLIVIAVGVFSSKDQSSAENKGGVNYGAVTVWGTVPSNAEMMNLFAIFNEKNEGTLKASYVPVPIENLEQSLLEALSNDAGPDVLILPIEWLQKNRLRITPIPYDALKGGISVRDFKDTYTQAGEVFLFPEGILARPLAIDPLVMYWNRDLFTNADIVSPPTFWKDILALTPKLTKKKNLDITQSTIALGEYENVVHAKDILSLMFLQIGSTITRVGASGALESALTQESPLPEAVRFYADFANPTKKSYSWNRALPSSQDAFLSNDLALYIDLASAYKTLVAKNPRLNFDIAPVPQTEDQPTAVTFGKVHGLAVMKKGRNIPGGLMFSQLFLAKEFVEVFAKASGMAPMRRDLLSVPQADAYQATLYSASLRARSWVDPQPRETDLIFSRMIADVISGKSTADAAVSQAHTEMVSLVEGKK